MSSSLKAGQTTEGEPSGESARAEFDRLVDGPKFPLRIDVRYNEKGYGAVDYMFEQVDYSRFVLQQQERQQRVSEAIYLKVYLFALCSWNILGQ